MAPWDPPVWCPLSVQSCAGVPETRGGKPTVTWSRNRRQRGNEGSQMKEKDPPLKHRIILRAVRRPPSPTLRPRRW